MKVFFAALFLAGGLLASAHAQEHVLHFNEHQQHAEARELPSGGDITVATGDGRVSIPAPPEPEPLGTAARRLRAEHASAPRAVVTLERIDSILKSTPKQRSDYQRDFERLLQRETYESDQQDVRRQTRCI